MEIWKNVIPYVWVSNLGNYRTEAREYPVYRAGKIIGYSHTKEKTVITEKGKYYQITVEGKHWYLHRLVALAFPEICGEWFEGADVDHIIPINKGGGNEATNLRFCTHKENLNNPNRIKQPEEEKKLRRREAAKKWRAKNSERIKFYMREYRKKRTMENA